MLFVVYGRFTSRPYGNYPQRHPAAKLVGTHYFMNRPASDSMKGPAGTPESDKAGRRDMEAAGQQPYLLNGEGLLPSQDVFQQGFAADFRQVCGSQVVLLH